MGKLGELKDVLSKLDELKDELGNLDEFGKLGNLGEFCKLGKLDELMDELLSWRMGRQHCQWSSRSWYQNSFRC